MPQMIYLTLTLFIPWLTFEICLYAIRPFKIYLLEAKEEFGDETSILVCVLATRFKLSMVVYNEISCTGRCVSSLRDHIVFIFPRGEKWDRDKISCFFQSYPASSGNSRQKLQLSWYIGYVQSYTSVWSCCDSEVTVMRWHLSILLGGGGGGVTVGGRQRSEQGSTQALKPASVSLLRQPASLNLTFVMCTVETMTLPRCRNRGVGTR